MRKNLLIIYTLSLLALGACSGDWQVPKPLPPSVKLDGTYDVQSIIIDEAIDLDRDGTKGVDLLAETHEAANARKYYLELSTTVHPEFKPVYYDQQISLFRPFANAFHDPDGNFLAVLYGFTNLLANYHYDVQTNEINIWHNGGNGEVHSMWLLNDSTLQVRFKASYFTTNNRFEDLLLTGTYRKR